MKKKLLFIILTIVFIVIIILINLFLKKQNEKILYQGEEQNNTNSEISKEEYEMDILKVNSQNFEEEVLKSEKPVLVDFYADWCGPCKMLSPIVDEVAQENEDIKVVKVNVDDSQDLAMKYQVMSIPTLVVIKEGNEINRSVGLIDKNQVVNMIK